MLTITDNAAEAVRQITANTGLEPDPGLRITAGEPTPQGTPLALSVVGAAESGDLTVEEGGARVYVDEPVAMALDDKVLDAEFEGGEVRFALLATPPGGAD